MRACCWLRLTSLSTLAGPPTADRCLFKGLAPGGCLVEPLAPAASEELPGSADAVNAPALPGWDVSTRRRDPRISPSLFMLLLCGVGAADREQCSCSILIPSKLEGVPVTAFCLLPSGYGWISIMLNSRDGCLWQHETDHTRHQSIASRRLSLPELPEHHPGKKPLLIDLRLTETALEFPVHSRRKQKGTSSIAQQLRE